MSISPRILAAIETRNRRTRINGTWLVQGVPSSLSPESYLMKHSARQESIGVSRFRGARWGPARVLASLPHPTNNPFTTYVGQADWVKRDRLAPVAVTASRARFLIRRVRVRVMNVMGAASSRSFPLPAPILDIHHSAHPCAHAALPDKDVDGPLHVNMNRDEFPPGEPAESRGPQTLATGNLTTPVGL